MGNKKMLNKYRKINTKISYNKMADLLFVCSFFLFTYRGNFGAIMAIFSMLFRLAGGKAMRNVRPILIAWILYLGTFAVVLYFIRNLNVEPYVCVAYIFAIFNMLLAQQINFNYIVKMIYRISFLYVFSVWLQFLFPSIYSAFARVIFPSRIYSEIIQRMAEGYMTGFTREVAYVALIVLTGLIYTVFLDKRKNKVFLSVFFIVTLFITGKKAHPILAILAIVLTYYFMTKNLKKHLKIWIICFILATLAIVSFPVWRNISFMSRIVVFINGIQNGLDLNALTSGREVIYQRAINLWSENKMFGIGWENFRNLGAYGMSEYTTWFKNYDIHNCYLQVLCENGLAGMIPFVVLLLYSIILSVKVLRDKNDVNIKYAFSYFLFFCLYAISEPCLFQDSYFILLFLCFSYIVWNKAK